MSFSNLYAGRLNRRNYALGVLMLFIVGVSANTFLKENNLFLINTLLVLVSLLFVVSLDVRRLHDVKKSGWWTILGFVPLVNIIFLFYLLKQPGDEKENIYGSKPEKKVRFPADILNLH